MKPQLSGSHRRAYDAIFRHPAARNLAWRDVRSMLSVLAEVVEEPNGNLKITRNGQTLVLHPSLDKNVAEIGELMQVRRFLERSGAIEPAAMAEGLHLLVVIDHRVARIYRTEVHGTVPQRITPYNPGGFGRHLRYVQDDSNGQRKPERRSFYEAVAKALQGAGRILVFGSGNRGEQRDGGAAIAVKAPPSRRGQTRRRIDRAGRDALDGKPVTGKSQGLLRQHPAPRRHVFAEGKNWTAPMTPDIGRLNEHEN